MYLLITESSVKKTDVLTEEQKQEFLDGDIMQIIDISDAQNPKYLACPPWKGSIWKREDIDKYFDNLKAEFKDVHVVE